MAVRLWNARSRTEKYRIVFMLLGIVAAMFFVLEANFIVRFAVLFVGGAIGFAVGNEVARFSRSDSSGTSPADTSDSSTSDSGGSSGGGDGGGD